MMVYVEEWPAKLAAMLKANAKNPDDAFLSSVIDSGGGDILGQVSKILKSGGKVVVYGMYVLLSLFRVILFARGSV